MNQTDPCNACKGTGESLEILGYLCPKCLGTGLKSTECGTCKGQGVIDQEMNLQVNVPKSVDDGMILRVKEKGHQALNGHFGDALFLVKVDNRLSEGFTRDGYNILTEKTVTLTQAIFGGECEIETINGMKKVQIQPGTQHNQQLLIKGHGMQHLGKNEKHGDHIITLKIQIPKDLNKEQKLALEKYATVES